MNPAGGQLLDLLQRPDQAAALDVRQWDDLLRLARRAGMLPRLACLIGDATSTLPPRAADYLLAARRVAEQVPSTTCKRTRVRGRRQNSVMRSALLVPNGSGDVAPWSRGTIWIASNRPDSPAAFGIAKSSAMWPS